VKDGSDAAGLGLPALKLPRDRLFHASNGRLRALNDGVATLESEVEAQKREMEASSIAKIQRVEELNCLIRVTDALLLSIHAVGADIASCDLQADRSRRP
jgi:hypothetical protein